MQNSKDNDQEGLAGVIQKASAGKNAYGIDSDRRWSSIEEDAESAAVSTDLLNKVMLSVEKKCGKAPNLIVCSYKQYEKIANQIKKLDIVIVSVGGGGLISGISQYLKLRWPDIHVVGCSPKNSAVMIHSIQAGKILNMNSKPTLSDGTAGGVEENSITFPICKEVIDKRVMVNESEIQQAMVNYIKYEHSLIEGAAGTAIAALSKLRNELKGSKVAVVICGGNISINNLRKVLH